MEDETMRPEHGDDELRSELQGRFPPASYPGSEIEERIRATVGRGQAVAALPAMGERDVLPMPTPWWRGPTARTALAVAASLVVFVAGAEYGRRTLPPHAPVPTRSVAVASGTLAPGPALSLQDAGSRYVASLARFSAEAQSLSPHERQVVREVALATIYGATLELLRASADDATLREVANMVAARRAQIGDDTVPAQGSS